MGLKYSIILLMIIVNFSSTYGQWGSWLSRLRSRGRGGGSSNDDDEECEWCINKRNCFRSAELEEVDVACTNCIADQCNDDNEFFSRRGYDDWLDCFEDSWESGPCTSVCPEYIYEDRVDDCRDCFDDCRDFHKDLEYDECSRSGDNACEACIAEDSCYDSDEILEEFSSFCIDYLYITCKDEDFSTDCLSDALFDDCSQCNVTDEIRLRLVNCTLCLANCAEENNCRQTCRDPRYPTSLSCPYCTWFCDEIDDEPDNICDGGRRCDTTCDACDACLEGCGAMTEEEFDFSNDCSCTEEKYIPTLFNILEPGMSFEVDD